MRISRVMVAGVRSQRRASFSALICQANLPGQKSQCRVARLVRLRVATWRLAAGAAGALDQLRCRSACSDSGLIGCEYVRSRLHIGFRFRMARCSGAGKGEMSGALFASDRRLRSAVLNFPCATSAKSMPLQCQRRRNGAGGRRLRSGCVFERQHHAGLQHGALVQAIAGQQCRDGHAIAACDGPGGFAVAHRMRGARLWPDALVAAAATTVERQRCCRRYCLFRRPRPRRLLHLVAQVRSGRAHARHAVRRERWPAPDSAGPAVAARCRVVRQRR